MPAPSWWKEFYASERAVLGRLALEQLIRDAPSIDFPKHGAIIFPHTRLSASGYLTAAAAKAVIDSGCDTVLALGVLHGIPRDRIDFHGIHFKDEIIQNEFSLDNFSVLLKLAADLAGKASPKYIPAYPLLRRKGAPEPESMTGFATLSSLIENGAFLVATADMVHHGSGYGTLTESRLAMGSTEAMEYSRSAIEEQLATLASGSYQAFLVACDRVHSDFRDVGPVLAALLRTGARPTILNLTLVNYADVLHAEEPTWVAAALATLQPHLT